MSTAKSNGMPTRIPELWNFAPARKGSKPRQDSGAGYLYAAVSAALEPLEPRQLLSCAPPSGSALALASGLGSSLTMHPNVLYATGTQLSSDAASSADVIGYTPAQIKTAYGFDQVSLDGTTGDGSGQTIAIVDAYNDPNIASDLGVFDAYFGLPAPPSLSIKSETGGSVAHVTTDAGWATEISLDVEWAHAIAPGANILLVEASSDNLNDLVAAVNYARSAPGVSVVSMSWGGSEFEGESTYDKIFTTPAGHNPVTFVTASGDDGPYYGPEWPAVSDNVVAVGGTTLNTLDSAGDYGSEQAWQYSTGGTSYLEIEPRYQSHVQMTTYRDNPDVAYDADPNTGFAIYDSLAYEGYVGWQEVGGTSAGAPQWAALIAIADQGRADVGKASLDSDLGTLPALYAIYNSSSTYSANFNDVVNSDVTGSGRHYFNSGAQASTGYDLATGLGTPQAATLVNTLVNATNLPASRSPNVRTPRPPGTATPVVIRPSERRADGSDSQPGSEPVSPAQQSAASALSTLLPQSMTSSSISSVQAQSHSEWVAMLADASSVSADLRSGGSETNSSGSVAAYSMSGTPIYFLPASDQGSADVPLATLLPSSLIPEIDLARMRSFFSGAGKVVAAGVELLPGLAPQTGLQVASNSSGPAYYIPTLGNVELFADALTRFANDSAAVGPEGGNMRFARAWTVTAAVLAADAALISHWYVKRRQARLTAAPASAWPFRTQS